MDRPWDALQEVLKLPDFMVNGCGSNLFAPFGLVLLKVCVLDLLDEHSVDL
ncbi:MAG: hypothetical protein ACM335_00930 [Deltaproteobacteria bacterium]